MKEHNPPAFLYFVLRLLLRKDMALFVLGDFDEEYHEIINGNGLHKAKIWYWKQVFKSLPKILKETLTWKIVMLNNYFRVTYRSMKRQKVFSLINILGLSIAIMTGVLIFAFIKDEFSYDRFHQNGERLYSVVKTDHHYNHKRRYIEPVTGPALKEYFSEVEFSTRVMHFNCIINYQDHIFREKCDFIDKDFFKMFTFPLVKGEPNHVLESKESVVLSQSASSKYFGLQDPLGKTITITFGEIKKDFFVTGIAKDVPENSFIQFEILMNVDTLTDIYGPLSFSNRNWTLGSTFIQLKQGTDLKSVESRLPAFFSQTFAPMIAERKQTGSWNKEGETITLTLQKLKDIHLYSPGIEGDVESLISKSYILSVVGLMIIFIAIINFNNLSIGRASTRTMEVGMRKIFGAGRINLIRQFRCESFITVFSGLIIGVSAALLALPLFNHLSGKNISEMEIVSIPNLLLFVGMSVVLSFLAGLYPGLVLSRIQPVKIIRGTLGLGGKNILSRFLILTQITVSVLLIISTLTLSRQLNFIFNKDLGYDRNGIVVINTFERRNPQLCAHIYNAYVGEAENLPNILDVSGCTFPLSSEIGSGKLTYNGKRLDIDFSSVYYNFCSTMGIKFISGGDFPQKFPEDVMPVIVTETFVKAFEIEEPLGKTIDSGLQIVGIVEDFHFWNLKQKIKPTVLIFDENGPRNILVRISGEETKLVLANLKSIWIKVQPDKPFDFSFESEIFEEKYLEEKRWRTIIFSASFLTLLITCLGLIGMAVITTGRRVKEIGIRRVLGARVAGICRILAGDYLILIFLGNLIAWPLGYYFMTRWLNSYAYRTSLHFLIFIFAGILSFTISTATIGLLVFKAASSDPVKSLRYE